MKPVSEASTAADMDRLIVKMRPRLHRYCARMTGSVIDGEDVLQDALVKAVESLRPAGEIGNPEGWLFRIAHNTALDFLRRRNRQEALRSGEEVDMIADPVDTVASRQIASTSLRTFMRLPVAQRSSVVLTDVLGCSLRRPGEITESLLRAGHAITCDLRVKSRSSYFSECPKGSLRGDGFQPARSEGGAAPGARAASRTGQ